MTTISTEVTLTLQELEHVTGGVVSDDVFGAPNACSGLERASLTAVRHGYYATSRVLANAARACRTWTR